MFRSKIWLETMEDGLVKWDESYVRESALESLRSPCHRPLQKLQIDCGALQDHLILYAFYLTYVCHWLFFVRTRFVCLFMCVCSSWQRFIKWPVLIVLPTGLRLCTGFWQWCRFRTCVWFRAFCDKKKIELYMILWVLNIVVSGSCFGSCFAERLDNFGKGEFRLLQIVEFSGFRVCKILVTFRFMISFSFFQTSHSLDLDKWSFAQLTHFAGFIHWLVWWSSPPVPQHSHTDPISTGHLFLWWPNLWQLKHLRGFGTYMYISTGIIR